MARISNFTDIQKAQIYVRDRATCAYSGEKLWILDGGVDPYFSIDWADHIFPVSQGGASTLDNGVCSSYQCNIEKKDKTEASGFLFYKGKATKYFYELHTKLPDKISHDLDRFDMLHYSDWYFNRAIFRTLLGVDYLHNGIGIRTRDNLYYAKAALKVIKKWRAIIDKEMIATLEERKLVPINPSLDQQFLLNIRESSNVSDILRIMEKLLPIYTVKAIWPQTKKNLILFLNVKKRLVFKKMQM